MGVERATPSFVECRFRFTELGGTTPKFNCALDSSKELRVKYGPGSEIPGEAAASRLLAPLGFGADTVTLVERLRCYGCPNEPFVTTKIVDATGAQPLYERVVDPNTPQDFEWVSVEQKFAARPIESDMQKGWAFFELESLSGRSDRKAPYSTATLLTTDEPYGPFISLDGAHPSRAGYQALAREGAKALNVTYHMAIERGNELAARP